MSKVCVIKAGSAVVTQSDGTLDFNMIGGLCRQIALAHEQGWQPLLVTSGAVASGRGFLSGQAGNAKKAAVSARTYAALGQGRLHAFYTDRLEALNAPLRAAQVLLTRNAFSVRERYTALRDTLREMIASDILPIINTNDVINVPQIDFTDNDHLAAYVAGMLDVDLLVLLSDIDGLYTDNPKTSSQARKVERLAGETEGWPEVRIDDSLSSAGGMRSKLSALKLMASLGIAAYITRGRTEDALLRPLVQGDFSAGTYLEARPETELDNYQRWLATGATPIGTIVVSNLGSDALRRRQRRASLLAVGVEAAYGAFPSGAVVAVRDESFDLLGVGRVKYSSDELRAVDQRPPETTVLHANYFLQVIEGQFMNTERPVIEQSVARWRGLGFSCSRVADGSLEILKTRDGGVKGTVRRATSVETRDLFARARLASQKIGVQLDDWLLFALLEGPNATPRTAEPDSGARS